MEEDVEGDYGETITAQSRDDEKAKLWRRWAFTVNVEKINDSRLLDPTFIVEGVDLSKRINKHNKMVRTTIWVGPIEPKEYDKKNAYAHRHCAVECTSGGISKMNAVNLLAKYLNVSPDIFTMGHDFVLTYAQPVKSMEDYKKYMFKIMPGRMTSDEEKIQQSVIKLRRDLRKNPSTTQVKQYLIDNSLLSFSKVASAQIKQKIELACELGDMYKSSSSEDGSEDGKDNDDGLKFLSKLSKVEKTISAEMSTDSVGFFDVVLRKLVEQLRFTTRGGTHAPLRGIFEVIALMIMPLFLNRNHNDQKTKSLVLYGRSKTGKSFISMQLVKVNKLHQIATDAKGVGRFDANNNCTGFFFDDVPANILKSSDAPTIKNLAGGDSARVKVFGKTTDIRGWTIITCQTQLERDSVDAQAWGRRFCELCFDDCKPFEQFTTNFDIIKRSNVDEMLTFLYYVIHKPKMMHVETVIVNQLITSSYYDDIICAQFNKLSHGTNLLRLLSSIIVDIEKTFDLNQLSY